MIMKFNFDLSCPNRIPLRCHQGNMTCRICESHGIPSPKSRLRPLTKTQREALVKARFRRGISPLILMPQVEDANAVRSRDAVRWVHTGCCIRWRHAFPKHPEIIPSRIGTNVQHAYSRFAFMLGLNVLTTGKCPRKPWIWQRTWLACETLAALVRATLCFSSAQVKVKRRDPEPMRTWASEVFKFCENIIRFFLFSDPKFPAKAAASILTRLFVPYIFSVASCLYQVLMTGFFWTCRCYWGTAMNVACKTRRRNMPSQSGMSSFAFAIVWWNN